MMRTLALCVTILSACVLVGFDDDVPWLDFPDDVRYRRYKIGNVVSGKDPQDLDAVIEAIEIVEGLSRGGRRDRAVISVPAWLNWDGVVPQGEVEFVQAIRIVTNNEVERSRVNHLRATAITASWVTVWVFCMVILKKRGSPVKWANCAVSVARPAPTAEKRSAERSVRASMSLRASVNMFR